MPRKIQKLSILNNLESRLNEDTDNIIEELQELSRIVINGFNSEVEFKKYLSEGALLNVNKLVSNALSIPCGEYMVLVYASDTNSVLVPTSEDTSIADAQPSTVNIHPNKLIGLWDKIERVIGEDDDFGPNKGQGVKQKKHKKDATTLADLFDLLPTDQASLAKEIGVDEPSVSRWTAPAGDASHRTPTVDHIKKIANATGVGVCSVLNMVSNNSSAGTKSRKGKGNSKSGSGGGAAWGGESIERNESTMTEMSSSGVGDAASILDKRQNTQDMKQGNPSKPDNNLQKPVNMDKTNQFMDLLNNKLQDVDQDNPDQLADALDSGLHDVTNDVAQRATDMNQMAQKLKAIKLH